MKYYLRQQAITQPKNKAQKHFLEFIKQFDQTLVDSDEDLNHIFNMIEAEVAGTNEGHPRCQDIQINRQAYAGDDPVSLWLHTGGESSFASLVAMKVKKEYHQGIIEHFIL
jgi:hypothetical protein